jgi:FtsH-binding integral membrane protein
MNKHQEKVLLAMLCGLVITAAGAFVVQPALATSQSAPAIWSQRI